METLQFRIQPAMRTYYDIVAERHDEEGAGNIDKMFDSRKVAGSDARQTGEAN